MRYYFDHTEFKVDNSATVKDTVVMGGILISKEAEDQLCNLIKETKSNYTHPDLPMKYNLKDLKAKYIEHNRLIEYEKMLHESAIWRRELFTKSIEIDYKVVLSVIQNFQISKKENQKDIKAELLGFAFADILMRLGLEVKGKNYPAIQIISDWPDSNNPKPFNHHYYYGYSRGHTPHNQNYYCGKLNEIGFYDTVLFASMNHSNMLQFSDLVIGGVRDFLTAHFDQREYSIGKEMTEIILKKVRGFPKNINHGISVSSNNSELKQKINNLISQYIA